MLASPPPLTKPEVDGLRFRHPWLDASVQFTNQVINNFGLLPVNSLRLAQSIFSALNKALAYRIQEDDLSVNAISYLFGQKRIAYDMGVACGLQVNDAGVGYVVDITQAALSALSALSAWNIVLQPTPTFDVMNAINVVIAGVSVAVGGVSTTSNPQQLDYLYVIRESDDLPGIAQKITGNAANWQAIAQYNQLRAPYISDNPQDQYGPILTQGTLSGTMGSGATQVQLPGANPQVMTYGVILYIQTYTASGTLVYQTYTVESFDPTTSVATISAAIAVGEETFFLSNDFPARIYTDNFSGAMWIVFPNPMDVTTKVLTIGSVLHIPGVLVSSSNLVSTNQDYLGTDIALTNGQVMWSNGDLATVAGIANLRQALQNRFSTPYGTISYLPVYGFKNPTGTDQGAVSTVALLYITETALQDPRIATVTNQAYVQTGAGAKVNATVSINNSNATFGLEANTT